MRDPGRSHGNPVPNGQRAELLAVTNKQSVRADNQRAGLQSRNAGKDRFDRYWLGVRNEGLPCKFGDLGTMVADIAAHLLMQDALAALCCRTAASRGGLGTGGRISDRHRSGLPALPGACDGSWAVLGLGQSPMVSAFSRLGTLEIRADLSPWSSHLGTIRPGAAENRSLGGFYGQIRGPDRVRGSPASVPVPACGQFIYPRTRDEEFSRGRGRNSHQNNRGR